MDLLHICKKEQEGWIYENDVDKKIIGHSKLKLWTFSEVVVNVNDYYSSYSKCLCITELLDNVNINQ